MKKEYVKKLINAYDSLQHFYFSNEKGELNYEDKPYMNMLELLYTIFCEYEFFSEDLLEYAVISYLRQKDKPQETNENAIEEFIKYIINIFDINKQKHFLVFPLQGSGIKSDVAFSNFYILKEKNEEALLNQISEITNMGYCDVRDFFRHTKNSRSQDFLKSNMMIIEIDNQTYTVKGSAYQMAQTAINILKLIHSAFEMESSIFRKTELCVKKNSHVAIISKDSWRCGHGFKWNANLQCKLDVDFIAEKKHQKTFSKMFDLLFFKRNDQLNRLFINAFGLFEKATIQRTEFCEYEISLLLYLTALESLFTEGKNEKRLRIAAIVPRVIHVDPAQITELAEKLDVLYMQRNNFLHAGKVGHYKRIDIALEQLEQTVAKAILKILEMDDIIYVEDNESRLSAWNKYTDNIFKNIILGK